MSRTIVCLHVYQMVISRDDFISINPVFVAPAWCALSFGFLILFVVHVLVVVKAVGIADVIVVDAFKCYTNFTWIFPNSVNEFWSVEEKPIKKLNQQTNENGLPWVLCTVNQITSSMKQGSVVLYEICAYLRFFF